jgi:peptidoglycan LD-endopeptidase CwlK
MGFRLSENSSRTLSGVHPLLVAVTDRATTLSRIAFIVLEGRRSVERQAMLYASGISDTMNSRHLTGHAVDLAPWANGAVPWEDTASFHVIRDAMFAAAGEFGAILRWGAEWREEVHSRNKKEIIYEGPHFELAKKYYP